MLTISQMTKVYKSGRGIFNMNLDVQQGDIYGLLGPNGAGKTTLLKIAAGLLNKDDGVCTIGGKTMEADPVSYKQQMVGMIGDTVLYEYLTPMDHLSMMDIYRDDITIEEKHQVLEEMDLYLNKDEKVKQFSTGMKQRLAFAMCLIARPKVLLLDEPFSGLDIEGKLLVRDRLLRLRHEGETAVLISSHLIHDLEEIALRVGVIKNGRMIAEESVEELLRHHRNLEDYFIKQTAVWKEGA